jgi:hypothetical protein
LRASQLGRQGHIAANIEHRAVFTAGPMAQICHRSYLNQA